MRINHYKWLEKHFSAFSKAVGLNGYDTARDVQSLCGAHGDKCYCYERQWKEAGIEFSHGVAMYLLTYHKPFSAEVRETKNGWVAPSDWVIKNKDRFLPLLPPVDPNDKDVCDAW